LKSIAPSKSDFGLGAIMGEFDRDILEAIKGHSQQMLLIV
jgi:hypothetical protein